MYLLAVLVHLTPGLNVVRLLQPGQGLNQRRLLSQSSQLSSLQIVEELNIDVPDLTQLHIHTLADHMNVIDTRLDAPDDCQKALQSRRIIILRLLMMVVVAATRITSGLTASLVPVMASTYRH